MAKKKTVTDEIVTPSEIEPTTSNILSDPASLWLNENNSLYLIGLYYNKLKDGEVSKLPNSLLQCTYLAEDGETHLLMASPNCRHFFNYLGSHAKNILEVGAYLGGSAVAFAYNNNNEVITIDDFSEEHGQQNVKERMLEHISNCKNLSFVETNALFYNFKNLNKKFDVIFVDGNHGYLETKVVVEKIIEVMDDFCLIIVDDWAMHDVQQGTLEALDKLTTHDIKYKLHLHGTQEDETDSFWNHIEIIACNKK